jgi:predicted MFS family arabinose efflux permease
MAPIALAFSVLDISGSGSSRLGIALAFRTVPMLAMLLVGGAWADRMPRHRLLVGSDVIAGAAQFALAALVLSGRTNFAVLLALVATTGIATGVLLPAMTGIVPSLVEPNDLPAANALLRLSVNVGQIGGAAAGGLIAAWSPGIALMVDAATFLISAIFVGRLGTISSMTARESMLSSLRSGWEAFTSRRWIVIVVVAAAFNNGAISAMFGVLGPTLADAEFGRRWWGTIVASFTIGLLVGGLLGARSKSNHPMLAGSMALAGGPVALAFLALNVTPILICIAVGATGFGFEFFTVLWDTALQRNVPHDVLSRVSAYDWLGSMGIAPLFQVMAGPAVLAFGIGGALWAVAAVSAFGVALPLVSHEVRTLTNVGE